MNKNDLLSVFDHMSPDEDQKAQMLKNIANGNPANESLKRRKTLRRRAWIAVPAACLALALMLFISAPWGENGTVYAINVKIGSDDSVFKLADYRKHSDDFGTSVSNVDARPGLEFYIEGENIAKIEISSATEYLYAVDWTKTQHEKYWNSEYYQYFDEERQVSVADFSLLFDKTMTMTFDEGFTDYDQIWYRWTAQNMHNWAAEDNYSRFLGAGMQLDDLDGLDEQDKMALAAGDDGSGIGHMQLDDYPEELKEDRITITITDREGNSTTRVIHVKVSNNELRQTVVTASLAE